MSYTPLDESSEHFNGNGGIHVQHEDDDDEEELQRISSPPSSASSPSALVGNSRKSLQEPLTATKSSPIDVSDPFYVFREDLYRKLESVDESLAEYLGIVHQTVSSYRCCSAARIFDGWHCYSCSYRYTDNSPYFFCRTQPPTRERYVTPKRC